MIRYLHLYVKFLYTTVNPRRLRQTTIVLNRMVVTYNVSLKIPNKWVIRSRKSKKDCATRTINKIRVN
jgi:hypothetical protein